MSRKLKIALLCSNKMALPAIKVLYEQGMLCGVATPDSDPEVVQLTTIMVGAFNIPYTKITATNKWMQLMNWLQVLQPDVVFVMTFPWKIPVHLLLMPQLGFINFHYGLLPEMRGADPVFEAIRQQHGNAGVTVHIMDAEFDTGPILMKETVRINPEFTYGLLCGQLAMKGAEMCHSLVSQLRRNGLAQSVVQDDTHAKYWPRISKQELYINWTEMDRGRILALVKACNPIARGVPVKLNSWEFGIYDATEINLPEDLPSFAPGTILALDPQNGLMVCCKNGKAIKIEVISTAEGVFPGYKLMNWGVKAGMLFSSS